MKNLIITIFFMFAFLANAQIELAHDYTFKEDKKLHVKVAAGISASVYTIAYLKTKEARGSFRAACMFPLLPIIGKEFFDVMGGGEFSMSDIVYGEVSALFTSAAMYAITELTEEIVKKRKAKKIKQRFNVSFLPVLSDEPLIKKNI